MILLDTCVIVFDALAPESLGKWAAEALRQGRENGALACSDISLWELSMLIRKERLKPAMPARDFLADVVAANRLVVLPITVEIAWGANFCEDCSHGDPADRIIAATARHHKIPLVTCDARLRGMKGLKTIW